MRTCGLIVEYNPFHNGHAYHNEKAKEISQADCVIAVMSGNFLQRGEPAIIDKFFRAKAALLAGVDIVLELPYTFAVQHSNHFAYGAVHTLDKIGVSSICFGSESGEIKPFIDSYYQMKDKKEIYESELKLQLDKGLSFPEASMHAYQEIGLTNEAFDLSQPNNVLGFSYVKTILDSDLNIEALTIKRQNNHYHDSEITNRIASATSIRKEILESHILTEKAIAALPESTIMQMDSYKEETSLWHEWEQYFPLLHYRVQIMSPEELREIHGMVEGLEFRVKRTAKTVKNMNEWITAIKTKRYTWTRIQRMFVHLLTNTKTKDISPFLDEEIQIPYIRLLGMTKNGREFLNQQKKDIEVPLITSLSKHMHPMLQLEEKATSAYYSILPPEERIKAMNRELRGPIII
ncbi:nucleotidyltransferase [Oceanobacillus sp. CAU 1775]